MPACRLTGVLLLVCAFWVQSSSGQDAHYWAIQYGTRSTLLSGAVIGSVEDLGAVYYNPGKLGIIADPSFLLSAQILEFNKIEVENGAGQGADLASSRFGTAPGLVAGSFAPSFLKGHYFAYSILPRQRAQFNLLSRQQFDGDFIEEDPGEERVGTEFRSTQDLDELWTGLTWAYGLSEHLGIGATPFLAIRSQSTSVRALAQTRSSTGRVATAIITNDFDYKHYRGLVKMGIAYDRDPLSVGLSVTTPGLSLEGSGTRFVTDTQSGGDLNGDGESNDELLGNLQTGVAAQYRSSWAVGAGGAYAFRRFRLHLSGEWFDSVPQYDILETEAVVIPSTGDTISVRIAHELKEVFNYGVGLEFPLGPRSTGYASFITDHSAVLSEPGTRSTVETWDLYQMAGGAVLAVGATEFTLGASYTFGNDTIETEVDIVDTGDDELIGRTGEARVRITRWRFLFGLSFDL